jgi:hypothetical protein
MTIPCLKRRPTLLTPLYHRLSRKKVQPKTKKPFIGGALYHNSVTVRRAQKNGLPRLLGCDTMAKNPNASFGS